MECETRGDSRYSHLPYASPPPSKIATLIHSLSSMVHFNNPSRLGVPYLAKQPVMQALSPKHFAVQVSPFLHSGSSWRHALACNEHLFTRQSLSTNDVSRPLPPYLAYSSSSALAELNVGDIGRCGNRGFVRNKAENPSVVKKVDTDFSISYFLDGSSGIEKRLFSTWLCLEGCSYNFDCG